jgi:N-acetylglucosamine repressor
LLARGIIREIGSVSTGMGRRPVELDMNTERNYVLGLRLGSFAVRSMVTDIKGQPVEKMAQRIDASGSRRHILAAMLACSRQLLQRRSIPHSGLAGIGIAAPGAVDFRTGICHYAPHHPNWKNVPLKEYFESEFGVPCYVDHVSNCFALSEMLFGFGKGLESFVCVLLGTGVSAGIVIHGEVYRGADCYSGEFGHTCIDMNGPVCACGNRGCVEAYTAGPALARMAAEKLRSGRGGGRIIQSGGESNEITAEAVCLAAGKGDKTALAVLRQMGAYLGIGVSNLINLFNPERVIIGGRVSKASEFFLPAFQDSLGKYAWHGSSKDVRISRLENGPVLGAVAIVLQEIFGRGHILR